VSNFEEHQREQQPAFIDPSLVINTRLSEIERQQSEEKAEAKKHARSQRTTNWLLTAFTGLLFVTSCISDVLLLHQTSISKESADAAKSAANTASQQVKLMRQQLESQQAAVIRITVNASQVIEAGNPIPLATRVDIGLRNVGHSIASNIHVVVKISKKNMRRGNPVVLLPVEFRIPKLQPEDESPGANRQPIYKEYPLSLSKEEERLVGSGQYAIVMEGSLDYDNGFGTSTTEPVCVTYWADYHLAENGRDVAASDGGSATCDDFAIRLPGILQNQETQRKNQK